MQRVCVNCQHWHVDYEGDYSDTTPGDGFTMWCDRKHYHIYGSGIESDEHFRSLILKAEKCEDFDGVTVQAPPQAEAPPRPGAPIADTHCECACSSSLARSGERCTECGEIFAKARFDCKADTPLSVESLREAFKELEALLCDDEPLLLQGPACLLAPPEPGYRWIEKGDYYEQEPQEPLDRDLHKD